MPISCHFRDCKALAGCASDSCKQRHSKLSDLYLFLVMFMVFVPCCKRQSTAAYLSYQHTHYDWLTDCCSVYILISIISISLQHNADDRQSRNLCSVLLQVDLHKKLACLSWCFAQFFLHKSFPWNGSQLDSVQVSCTSCLHV